jgi:hypothetical protein
MRLLILLITFAACTAAIAAEERSSSTQSAVRARDAAVAGAATADAGLPAAVSEALRRVSHPADPYVRWDKVDFDNLHRCAVGCGG